MNQFKIQIKIKMNQRTRIAFAIRPVKTNLYSTFSLEISTSKKKRNQTTAHKEQCTTESSISENSDELDNLNKYFALEAGAEFKYLWYFFPRRLFGER